MSCDGFQVGNKVEAVAGFQIQEALAAPVAASAYEIQPGDRGEVAERQRVGNTHWLRIRWERLGRTLNLRMEQFDMVRPAD